MIYDQADDLKRIKKEYGENMMHLCRSLFPTILDTSGALYYILSTHFAKSKSLYDDIIREHKEYEFKEYIYHLFDLNKDEQKEEITPKSVKKLLDEAGYELFECRTYEDVLKFKKYYAFGEELCTFRDPHRIDNNYIFFIVKKDVNKINRKDFKDPKREDEYSTSVLDLQFSKGSKQRVSIKSRYNHVVNNPDATYSNNLEKIALGLTMAFEKEYGFNIGGENSLGFELDHYVEARDGKFYKYNYEINNIHYCLNNIIINDGNIIDTYYDKSRYTFMDYFILDESEKRIIVYDNRIKDSFLDDLQNITNIEITNEDGYKKIELTLEYKIKVIIKLDNQSRIIGYENKELKNVDPCFLEYNEVLNSLNLPNLQECGYNFLYFNKALTELNLPSLQKCTDNFLQYNKILNKLYLPHLQECNTRFLENNQALVELDFPSLREAGSQFLRFNQVLNKLSLPNLRKCGFGFLENNLSITELNLPNLEECEYDFLESNKSLTELSLPKLQRCGANFLRSNKVVTKINLQNLKECSYNFLYLNEALIELNLPVLEKCGFGFLRYNEILNKLSLPKLEECESRFLQSNKSLRELSLPSLQKCGGYFLSHNEILNKLDLPNLEECGSSFMEHNDALTELSLPSLQKCGLDFLQFNSKITKIYLPKLRQTDFGFLEADKMLTKSDILNTLGVSKYLLSHLKGKMKGGKRSK